MTTPTEPWKRCSSCKTPIGFETAYYRCSVSTCNQARTALYFCSVACWEAHRESSSHRDAWAEEDKSPTIAESDRQAAAQEQKRKKAKTTRKRAAPKAAGSVALKRAPKDLLIAVSKFRAHVKEQSGMNTADGVFVILSEHLRALSDHAIQHAGANERQTVIDRDYEPVIASFEPRSLDDDDDSPPSSDGDVLVITARLKAYNRARGAMNTSADVLSPLSNHLRDLCRVATRNAALEERATVMDQDFARAVQG